MRQSRELFDALNEDGTGRLSAEDLELVRQRRLLRISPKLRQRQLRRALRLANGALRSSLLPGMRAAVRESAEELFPHWRSGRTEPEAEVEEEAVLALDEDEEVTPAPLSGLESPGPCEFGC